ncbi:hypothetical protein Dimus_024177, partial [Dionaea muscipula]
AGRPKLTGRHGTDPPCDQVVAVRAVACRGSNLARDSPGEINPRSTTLTIQLVLREAGGRAYREANSDVSVLERLLFTSESSWDPSLPLVDLIGIDWTSINRF